jgi:hypothetical protein
VFLRKCSLQRLLHARIVLDDKNGSDTLCERKAILGLSDKILGINHISEPFFPNCHSFHWHLAIGLLEITIG